MFIRNDPFECGPSKRNMPRRALLLMVHMLNGVNGVINVYVPICTKIIIY